MADHRFRALIDAIRFYLARRGVWTSV